MLGKGGCRPSTYVPLKLQTRRPSLARPQVIVLKILFLDESGDHNLSVIDPQYPIFVIGGVIVDEDYARGPLNDALDEFKDEELGAQRHRAAHSRHHPQPERVRGHEAGIVSRPLLQSLEQTNADFVIHRGGLV